MIYAWQTTDLTIKIKIYWISVNFYNILSFYTAKDNDVVTFYSRQNIQHSLPVNKNMVKYLKINLAHGRCVYKLRYIILNTTFFRHHNCITLSYYCFVYIAG